jgi:hypothetical protein
MRQRPASVCALRDTRGPPCLRSWVDTLLNEPRALLPAALALGAVAVWLIAAASPAAQAVSFVDRLLERERFSTAERRAIGEGKAVVKSLDTPVRRELAHFGGVYIDAPADCFVERFDDIERFEKGPGMHFHTTLELRFVVEDERRAGRRGFHLFSITRSRNDGTTGLMGAFLRPVISRRSRTAVRGYLEHLKRQVERAEPAPF